MIKSLVRQYLARRFKVPEIPVSLNTLALLGFSPDIIFDVGAYQGDFAKCCCKIFPNAQVVCFEVLEHKVQQLEKTFINNAQIQVFPTLLGAETKEAVPLHNVETASSILLEHIPQNFPVTFHPMTTVDEIVANNFDARSPDLLKLDVQGYELEVLKGAENTLQKIQVILVELNLLDIHQNCPLFAEVVGWLNERDWVAYDICGLTRRPLDSALWQADLMFVHRDSLLRRDKRWGKS
jgi:FkbM family methyltransferase